MPTIHENAEEIREKRAERLLSSDERKVARERKVLKGFIQGKSKSSKARFPKSSKSCERICFEDPENTYAKNTCIKIGFETRSQ